MPVQAATPPQQEELASDEEKITTEEEVLGWNIVRAILAEVADLRRISLRGQQSYCAILFDNNNRRPICRLHFNSAKRKYLGLFDESRVETRVPLEEISDIYKHAGHLKATVARYLGAPPLPPDGPQPQADDGVS